MKKRTPFVIAAFLIVGFIVLWQISRSRTFQFFGQLVPSVNTAKGSRPHLRRRPTPEATGPILSALDRGHVRATFFVTGAELEKNMAEGRKIIAPGRELGDHSYSHERRTPTRSPNTCSRGRGPARSSCT